MGIHFNANLCSQNLSKDYVTASARQSRVQSSGSPERAGGIAERKSSWKAPDMAIQIGQWIR